MCIILYYVIFCRDWLVWSVPWSPGRVPSVSWAGGGVGGSPLAADHLTPSAPRQELGPESRLITKTKLLTIL